ncbi:MAG: efflux RND transporter periplasmic adaptor subunit [Acidobacteria bacterium]|nr:efflux RND transporter periplasmic adaptor subunit [Acidobacteriota bacterium]
MVKRMILMLSVTTVFLGALGFVKFQQFQAAAGQAAAFQPPPEAVTTIVARQDTWPATLSAIGTTAPVQGVTVSADLPGIVNRIRFESGRAVREGDVLVELDTRQEEAQLTAVEAQRDLARLTFKRMEGLVIDGAISRADYDQSAAEQKQTEARVGEIRATIERKTIRGVPQQEAGQVRPGRRVRITAADASDAALAGRITAVDSIVDEATRNVTVQATLANPAGKLRPGMFVQAEVTVGASRPVVALPASAISYAPYGDSIFVVTDLKDPEGKTYRGVRQQFVKLGSTRGDQIAVVSGVEPGDEVVTSGVFKLRNGAGVLINNKVRPTNELAPKPEES